MVSVLSCVLWHQENTPLCVLPLVLIVYGSVGGKAARVRGQSSTGTFLLEPGIPFCKWSFCTRTLNPGSPRCCGCPASTQGHLWTYLCLTSPSVLPAFPAGTLWLCFSAILDASLFPYCLPHSPSQEGQQAGWLFWSNLSLHRQGNHRIIWGDPSPKHLTLLNPE